EAVVGRDRRPAAERARAEIEGELEDRARAADRVGGVERAALVGADVEDGLALEKARRDRSQVLLAPLVGVQDGGLLQAEAVELPDLHADARHALAARRRGVAVPGVGRDQAAEGRRCGRAEGRDDALPRERTG